MKKAHDLRDLPLDELESMERDRAEELMNLRLRLKLQQLDNPLQVRLARKEIAALKTVIKEKKRQAVEAEQ
jgi:large subunit ribosomal protein L29